MYCRQCQYDLRHLENGECPECGAVFDRHSAETYLEVIPPSRISAWAIAILLAVGASTAVILIRDEVATLYVFIISTALSGIIGAIDARRQNAPATYRGSGGYGGAVWAVAVTIMLMMLAHVWFVGGYFFYQGAQPYFMDGWVNEVFVFPVFACFIYGMAGGMIGMMTGTLASLCMGLKERLRK